MDLKGKYICAEAGYNILKLIDIDLLGRNLRLED